MIDLSITKDPEWIKKREEAWKPIGDSLKEGLKKKEVEKIHRYFMTGILRDGEELSDGAKFYWFPIQTPTAWDYIFENMFDSKKAEKEFEDIFYFQLGDLTGRALTEEQELDMWDYFAGDNFQSVVNSRVPVGKSANYVSFELDYGKVAAKFSLGIKGWLGGLYGNNPKWISRINYFLTFLEQLPDSIFDTDGDGVPSSRAARVIQTIFTALFNKKPDEGVAVNEEGHHIRQEFIMNFRKNLDVMNMSPAMKKIWEEAKVASNA